jgi:hypothetical protein
MTVKVMLHAYNSEKRIMDASQELRRMPAIGEYITIPDNTNWFEVELVVHWLPSSSLEGEVYALEVDPQKILDDSGFGRAISS